MDDIEFRRRMTGLAHSFPCLRDAPGASPWDPAALDRWADGPASHGERVTARFVLAVWDRSANWASGPFDLMDALDAWPESHREPFLRWAENPWWP